MVNILNSAEYCEKSATFRTHCLNKYPATEIAYIQRYIKGETELIPDVHFSRFNLELIQTMER